MTGAPARIRGRFGNASNEYLLFDAPMNNEGGCEVLKPAPLIVPVQREPFRTIIEIGTEIPERERALFEFNSKSAHALNQAHFRFSSPTGPFWTTSRQTGKRPSSASTRPTCAERRTLWSTARV